MIQLQWRDTNLKFEIFINKKNSGFIISKILQALRKGLEIYAKICHYFESFKGDNLFFGVNGTIKLHI